MISAAYNEMLLNGLFNSLNADDGVERGGSGEVATLHSREAINGSDWYL